MIRFLLFVIFSSFLVTALRSFSNAAEVDMDIKHNYCSSGDYVTASYNLLNIPFAIIDEKQISLAHLYRKKVVVAFWTQWDIEAFTLLKSIHVMERYAIIKDSNELFLMAIAIDTPSIDVINEIFERNGITLQNSFIDASLVFSNAIPAIMNRTNVMLFTEGKYCILTEKERAVLSHQEPEENELMMMKYFSDLIKATDNNTNKNDFVFHVNNQKENQATQYNDKNTNIVIYSSHSEAAPKLIQ
ncbi:hypothetical protein Fsol_00652 [Candidatus Fokinia solitaria]|uniref:Uncharacterized protein n=1 Tax=Candidatus Fokinia solitaria TaxID=1802984 RepID=A0A2U8BT33_9RICK|nr:hypothetical protein [Candidatus Fokinia solitaria]AWD33430.1 hypothetical protein Fsol_00652 [Candidatus Fokinia solitaria]